MMLKIKIIDALIFNEKIKKINNFTCVKKNKISKQKKLNYYK